MIHTDLNIALATAAKYYKSLSQEFYFDSISIQFDMCNKRVTFRRLLSSNTEFSCFITLEDIIKTDSYDKIVEDLGG